LQYQTFINTQEAAVFRIGPLNLNAGNANGVVGAYPVA
jgi:hypothetical protein